MLSFRNNLTNILNHVKDAIKLESLIDTPDLVIICENGDKVLSHISLFCLFSSNMRLMCENGQSITLLLPSFKKTTVEQVIKLMMMDWDQGEEWNSEVVKLLHTFGIHVGTFYLKNETNYSLDIQKFTLDLEDIKIEIKEEDDEISSSHCEKSEGNVKAMQDDLESNDEKIMNECEDNIDQIEEIGEMNITDNEESPVAAEEYLKQLRKNENNLVLNKTIDIHDNTETIAVNNNGKDYLVTNFDDENIEDIAGESISDKPKKKNAIACPICDKVYKGQSLYYQLKIHIGFHHFLEDITKEFETYFQDVSCKVCEKTFKGDCKKKVHLILNHSEVSTKIRDVANKAYDIPPRNTKKKSRNKVVRRKDNIGDGEEKEENKLKELRNRLQQYLVQHREESKKEKKMENNFYDDNLLYMNLLKDTDQPSDEEK